MRHALLENDIISKLLQRISNNRLGLTNFYINVEKKTLLELRKEHGMDTGTGNINGHVGGFGSGFGSSFDDDDIPPGHIVGCITRDQWAEGLRKVLKLNIPFLEFQDYLGLPKLGVDGKRRGKIDYQAFLIRFKPFNKMMKFIQNEPQEVQKSMERLCSMLSKHRYELESLFRHFDTDGDEQVCIACFVCVVCFV